MYNLSLSLNTDLLVHLCHQGVQFFTERCNLIGQSFCNVCSYYLFLLRNCFNKSSIKYWTMRMTISKRSVILFTTLQNNSLYYERIYSKPVRYQKKYGTLLISYCLTKSITSNVIRNWKI